MRRRVVCPRSHPASLYVQGSFGALSRRLALLAGGTPPETPQSAAPSPSSAKPSVKLGLLRVFASGPCGSAWRTTAVWLPRSLVPQR
jgi:hypothetical protein